ncbi:hypothetical protein [Adhaeretor mobilis]|uniref:Uncharacterized protein n=1 Tax=Adhaeretor mobilis TaxID=1930276 RepID=A0A517N1Z2_9BACT|nr:hypothetical protein [Adhaeretor mobilis]QDT01028.1 hypothetical protein HG15A2_43700 [Adhaeretor mobilis]
MRLIILLAGLILLGASQAQAQSQLQLPPPHKVDVQAAQGSGLRELRGKHLRLFTDLPASESVDELPSVFDAAVPVWAKYFGVPLEATATWRVQGFLIKDREKFEELDLLPSDRPNFLNGFAHDRELWLKEQPSNYYRRHLLLHEGTHAFMLEFLKGCGPGWHMEGLAELMGTHYWQSGKLQLAVMPSSREEVPMWGRVKLIRDAVAAGKPLSLSEVMRIDNRRVLTTTEYAWSWALASLLENHPTFQKKFHGLQKTVNRPQLSRRFKQQVGQQDWALLERNWLAMIATLDYGYDFERMNLQERELTELNNNSTTIEVATNRGWQSTGWKLVAGKTYRLTAEGRYQIALDRAATPPMPWACEPGGVTLEYHAGEPLGKLLAALAPLESTSGAGSFLNPLPIGLAGTLEPKVDSVLYLRVNDHPARLNDNKGILKVTITGTTPR